MYEVIRHDGTGVTSSGNKVGNPWHYKSNGRFANAPEALRTASGAASNTANMLEPYGRNMYTRKPRKDLSKLSDQELQQILNRERMERQYDDYFNPPRETRGKKFVDGTVSALKITGIVLGIVASGVAIYNGLSNKKPDLSDVTDDDLRAVVRRRKLEQDFLKYS